MIGIRQKAGPTAADPSNPDPPGGDLEADVARVLHRNPTTINPHVMIAGCRAGFE
jgi:hypothetical protein